MLLRQHQSIDSLTEVVKTQATTIAGLVSLLGAAAGAKGAAAAATVAAATGTATATAGGRGGGRGRGRLPKTRASGEMPTAGPRGGGGFVDDADAIAEMVAYLDDAETPNAAATAAADADADSAPGKA